MENNLPFEFLTEAEFEAFIERVGICQNEGELSIEDAQKLALQEILSMRVESSDSKIQMPTGANLTSLDKTTNAYPGIKLISARELQQKEFPPLNWIVSDLIAEGVSIIASKPKLGKSMLALNLSLAVSCGEIALQRFNTNQTNVLYLNLDDPDRRLQGRVNKMLQTNDFSFSEAPENLLVLEKMAFPKLNLEGLALLDKIIDDYKIGFVIVDTFELSIHRDRGESEYSYHKNYNLGNKLREFAYSKRISLMLIHHSKKESTEDVFDEILGSIGLVAAMDTMMVLRKYSSGVKLHFKGKDIITDEIDLVFDKDNYIWKVIDSETEIDITPERRDILMLLTDEAKLMKTGEIANKLNKKTNNISNILGKMLSAGEVARPKYGYYCIPAITNSFSKSSDSNESDASSESDVNSVSDESNES